MCQWTMELMALRPRKLWNIFMRRLIGRYNDVSSIYYFQAFSSSFIAGIVYFTVESLQKFIDFYGPEVIFC